MYQEANGMLGDTLSDYNAILNSVSEGIALFDADDRLTFANKAFASLSPDASSVFTQGTPWSVIIKEMDVRTQGHAFATIEQVLGGRLPPSHAGIITRRGRPWRQLTVHIQDDGSFFLLAKAPDTGAEASVIDDDAEEILRNVLDASTSSLVMCRVGSGHILYRTPAWAQLLGNVETAKEVYADPDDRSDLLADLLAAGYVDDFETNYLSPEGKPFPVRVSSRIVEYRGDDAIISCVQDMTQLYAQRDEIQRAQNIAWQAEKMSALGSLLAGVAHELNNPLSVVVGQALMLQDDVSDKDALRRVDRISTAAERCTKIVRTFLALARQKPAELVSLNLKDTVFTAIEVASFGEAATNVDIEHTFDDERLCVLGDEDQLVQVFLNLLLNAEQAIKSKSERGRIRVTVGRDAKSDRALVSIEDDGPGVPPAVASRIFEPFFTTKKQGQGTGIGLSLTHRIVDTHNGGIELKVSELGGARFDVFLPITDTIAIPPIQNLEPASEESLRVLLVEDESDVAETITEMLQGLGYSVLHAASADAALDLANTHARDVGAVVSDLRMPGKSGLVLFHAMKSTFPQLAERFIFLTGDTMSAEANEIRDIWKRPLLTKPVDPVDLRHAIEAVQPARKELIDG